MEIKIYNEADAIVAKHVELVNILAAAPLTIGALSNLCLISTFTIDFKLKGPKAGHNELNFNSFQACLGKIVQRGYRVLSLVDKSIAKIYQNSNDIASTVTQILDFAVNENLAVISTLPERLELVKNLTKESNQLTEELDKEFASVSTLINDLTDVAEVGVETLPDDVLKAMDNNIAYEDIIALMSKKAVNTEERVIRDALYSGLEALTSVRTQWAAFSRFFRGVSILVQVNMYNPLLKCISMATTIADRRAYSALMLRITQSQTQSASKAVFQVNAIMGTYLKISQIHLADQLAKLGSFVDPAKSQDKDKMHLEIQEIQEKCKNSSLGIKEIAIQDQDRIAKQFAEHVQGFGLPNASAKIQL